MWQWKVGVFSSRCSELLLRVCQIPGSEREMARVVSGPGGKRLGEPVTIRCTRGSISYRKELNHRARQLRRIRSSLDEAITTGTVLADDIEQLESSREHVAS